MAKKYDLCVVTGEYQNQQGETKKQYKNIGAVLSNDNGFYMILDRTFNAAGLPNPDNRSNCIVNMFEPKQQGQQPTQQQAAPQQQAPEGQAFDDSIPF